MYYMYVYFTGVFAEYVFYVFPLIPPIQSLPPPYTYSNPFLSQASPFLYTCMISIIILVCYKTL